MSPDEVFPDLVLRLYEAGVEPSLPAARAMLSVLDDVERHRAAQSANAALRTSFIAGRYLLRALAAELCDVEPARLTSSYRCAVCTPARGTSDHGQPGYSLDGATLPLALSLSRASGYVLLAALPDSGEARIGVDLETMQDASFAGFDEVALTANELNVVAGLQPGQQSTARARLWARKEALVKALGTGFAGRDPNTLDVLGDSRIRDVHRVDATTAVPDELVAAVAVVPSPHSGHAAPGGQ